MPNLVYTPGIRVYIQTEAWRRGKGKILDVSDDVVSYQVQLRSDGVSTLSFTLTNENRKYDQVFTPNDRIIVELKRITWLRIFTGYLNSVPEVTVWPKDVQIEASSTLKRLQYWYWDAYAPQTQTMIINAMGAANKATNNTGGDLDGIEVILEILEKVTNWPRTKVHIGQVPKTWFSITTKMAAFVEQNSEASDKVATALFSAIGAVGVVAGAGISQVTGKLDGKTIDGYVAEQLQNAEIIYSEGSGQGASTRDQIIAIMAAMGAGTNLTNVDNGNTIGTGVFQMKVSSGTGTTAQLMNINYAAKTFFTKLIGVSTRDNMSYGQEVATLLGKGSATDYTKYQKPATDIVNAIQAAAAQGTGVNTVPTVDSIYASGSAPSSPTTGSGGGANTNPQTKNTNTPTGSAPANSQPGNVTGTGLVGVAKSLVSQYPNIPYTEQYTGTRMDILTEKPPAGLDCSMFVQWVYMNAFGDIGPLGNARVVTQQRSISKIIDIKTALSTPGALCFVNGDHVEMSIGDGTHTIGAHHTGTMASVGDSPGQFTDGGLLPGVNFGALGQGGGSTDGSASAGNGSSTTSGDSWPSTVPYSQAKDGYNGANGWDKLFGNTPWAPVPIDPSDPGTALSMSLTGIKTFLNDQPLLPYLKNLMNGIMRSFCSAPNGDLIAWFPDYYGLWGTAAKFTIEPIEVLDFNVTWNDEYFVTHQYVATTPGGSLASNQLDLLSGTLSSNLTSDPIALTESIAYTRGIASIDVPAMMYALFGLDMNDGDAAKFAEYITSKFGVRPNFMAIPTVSGPAAEFFCAVFYFMRNWSYQYNADVPLTFMPELFPGMLMQIPSFGFQAYVTTVTHQGQFGDGGGFTTTVNIASPAKIAGGEYTEALGMIPEAAGINSRVSTALLAATPNAVTPTSTALTQQLNDPSLPTQTAAQVAKGLGGV